MKKALIVAATAIVLVGGSALGYHAYAHYDGPGFGRFGRMNADDMNAYASARIAALKAGLRLSAEQEPLWPPVESALSELANARIERRVERRGEWRERQQERRAERRGSDKGEARRAERDDRSNPVERLRKRAERLSETGAGLQRLADATDPLYQSLDDAQKRRFHHLSREGMRGAQDRRAWRRHGDAGRHMGPRGYERNDERERGPRGRDRMEWRENAPRGAERL